MECIECRTLLQSYTDDELERGATAQVSAHLGGCAACRADYGRAIDLKRTLRANLARHTPPPRLETALRRAIHGGSTLGAWRPGARMLWLNAGLAACSVTLLVAALVLFGQRPGAGERMAQEIAISHARALQVDHLTDVASSDGHTVKPWFAGKLPFSPPVVDLAREDFALVGARIDYVAEREVAALVYRRRGHVINLFVWPDDSRAAPAGGTPVRGFSQINWAGAGMRYWAVSDINPNELAEFAGLLRARIERPS